MQIKKLLLTIFITSNLLTANFQSPFASGIEPLDTVEQELYQEYIEQAAILQQSTVQAIEFNQRLGSKCMQLLIGLSEKIHKINFANKEEFVRGMQQSCKIVREHVKSDSDLTPVSIALVDLLCTLCTQFADQGFTLYQKLVENGAFDMQDLAACFAESNVQEYDFLTKCVEYFEMYRVILCDKLQQKNSLSFDDIVHAYQDCIKQLGLPQKIQFGLLYAVLVISQSMRKLPKEVIAQCVKLVQKSTCSIENKKFCELLHRVVVMRKKIIASYKNQLVNQNLIDQYADVVTELIMLKLNLEQDKLPELYTLYDAILFKKSKNIVIPANSTRTYSVTSGTSRK